jgi:SM-20-related protein
MIDAPQDLETLTALGLFVRPGLIEPDLCRRLREEARQALQVKATISGDDGLVLVDERTRRTKRAEVSEAAAELAHARVAGVRGEISQHFELELTDTQQPQFLLYRRGDFFRPHQDNSGAATLEDAIRLRQVSVVAFLNDQTRLPRPNTFCGGELRFFMLDPRATPLNARTTVRGEEGLVVAFRSDTFHEVAPVTAGERYSVVTWMVGPGTGATAP